MEIYVKNQLVKISKEDIELYKSRKWHIGDTGYLMWRGIQHGVKRTIRFHREVCFAEYGSIPRGMVVDHINHDKLDNRRENLRITTQSENALNRTNQGKGYWFHKQNNNWVVEIRGKHIGCFASENEAIKVVDFVRNGGVYIKPKRTTCIRGHILEETGYYQYENGIKRCKVCQLERARKYYERKKRNEIRQHGIGKMA